MDWIRTGITKSGYGIVVPAPEDGLELDCLKHEIVETETNEMPSGTWEYIPEVIEAYSGCQQGNYAEAGYVDDGYFVESNSASYAEAGYVESDYFEEDSNVYYAEEGYVADGYFDNIGNAGYTEIGYVENGYFEEDNAEAYAADGYVEEGYFIGECDSQGASTASSIIHRWSRWIQDPVDYPYVRDGYFDEDTNITPCSPYVNIVDELDDLYISYPYGDEVAGLLYNDRLSYVFGTHLDRTQRRNIAAKILNKEE